MILYHILIQLKLLDTSYVLVNRFNSECGCKHRCQPHSNGVDFECLCPDGHVVTKDGFGCGKSTDVAHRSTI